MKDVRFAKFVVLINALVPGTLLLWDVYHGHAGADPVNYAIHTTGILALIFLSLSLLVTPLRKITGLNDLFHFRRILGLYAFFYALAHFSIFFIVERSFSVSGTIHEMLTRKYLVVGSLALLCMLPLAITSFNYTIKRLGPRRWKALHRLAYVAAVLGVIHFWMQVKSDIRRPVAFAIVVGILLGYRLVVFLVASAKTSASDSGTVPAETARWSGSLRVAQIHQETPDVRTFRLVPNAGDALPFTYIPGQYLTLLLEIAGKPVRRNYTIASTPSRPGSCEVTIKRDDKGHVSRHMHDVIAQGDVISVTAPSGRFTFTGAESQSVALLAAGVGITPLMSIVRYLTDHNWCGHIHLIYCNKAESDIIFRAEIESLQQKFPNLHVTLSLTRAESSSWSGGKGRIDADLLNRTIPNLTTMPVYICGPAEMLKATRELLRQLGVAEANILTESFGTKPAAPASMAAAGIPDSAFTITFARSNKSAAANDGRPILELAEELGINVQSECRSGICGTCKCRMRSGSVKMETEDALTPADRKNGLILLCQARPLEDVTVDA